MYSQGVAELPFQTARIIKCSRISIRVLLAGVKSVSKEPEFFTRSALVIRGLA